MALTILRKHCRSLDNYRQHFRALIYFFILLIICYLPLRIFFLHAQRIYQYVEVEISVVVVMCHRYTNTYQ